MPDPRSPSSTPPTAPLPGATADTLLNIPARDSTTPGKPRPPRLGRYQLLRKLGEGGMGVVFAARDEQLQRQVAVKILHHTGDAQARRRFLREARAMAQVSHRNVVQVFEIDEHEGVVYIVMEYVDGSTLRGWLRERSRSRREILDVFVAAGRGLAAVHASGLVHRDFKPDNVMIRRDGQVIVMDFGLVRAARTLSTLAAPTMDGSQRPLTRVGAVLGTPLYMAPEQFGGGKADHRTDQFAFCVALWEALAGKRPHAGDSYEALERAVTSGTLDPSAHAGMAPWLRRALTRGLAVAPEERWPSMDDLLECLTRTPARHRVLLTVVSVGAVVSLLLALVWNTRTGPDAEATGAEATGADRPREDERRVNRATIDANVPAATVILDGQRVCTTPCIIEVPVGDHLEHEIVLRKEGYIEVMTKWQPSSMTERAPQLPELKPAELEILRE